MGAIKAIIYSGPLPHIHSPLYSHSYMGVFIYGIIITEELWQGLCRTMGNMKLMSHRVACWDGVPSFEEHALLPVPESWLNRSSLPGEIELQCQAQALDKLSTTNNTDPCDGMF